MLNTLLTILIPGFPSKCLTKMDTHEIESEVTRLAERIAELKSLQLGQKHLPFIVSHLEDHIQKLQRRIEELLRQSAGSA